MEATKYQLETTQCEIDQAYVDFRRMLNLGRSHEGVKQAMRLAKQDAAQLWSFLLQYASVEVNYRENDPVLVVNALWTNWLNIREDVFIARAVMTLMNAPKGDSVAKFL